jgi:hypothetical protein
MEDKILYSICTEDVNTVTQELFNRKPTKSEIEFLDRELGDFINWYDAVENALYSFKAKQKEEQKFKKQQLKSV